MFWKGYNGHVTDTIRLKIRFCMLGIIEIISMIWLSDIFIQNVRLILRPPSLSLFLSEVFEELSVAVQEKDSLASQLHVRHIAIEQLFKNCAKLPWLQIGRAGVKASNPSVEWSVSCPQRIKEHPLVWGDGNKGYTQVTCFSLPVCTLK